MSTVFCVSVSVCVRQFLLVREGEKDLRLLRLLTWGFSCVCMWRHDCSTCDHHSRSSASLCFVTLSLLLHLSPFTLPSPFPSSVSSCFLSFLAFYLLQRGRLKTFWRELLGKTSPRLEQAVSGSSGSAISFSSGTNDAVRRRGSHHTQSLDRERTKIANCSKIRNKLQQNGPNERMHVQAKPGVGKQQVVSSDNEEDHSGCVCAHSHPGVSAAWFRTHNRCDFRCPLCVYGWKAYICSEACPTSIFLSKDLPTVVRLKFLCGVKTTLS